MFKKICLIGLIAAAFSFAQEEGETYIRNICDTLPKSATPRVELKMTRVDVTQWYGSKDLSKKDSSSVKRYESYEAIKPYQNDLAVSLPYSITAACAETKYNLYKIAEWNQSKTSWDLNEDNDDYATYIMDVNMVEFPGYDASNSYNILAMKKGSLPTDGAYSSGELLVSKTFELQFDWWYTYATYKIETTVERNDTIYISTKWKKSYSYGLDSLSSVKNAIKGLDVPDSVSKIQFQQFHVVLSDPNKNVVASSSSEAASSSSVASSSSEAASSSSIASSSSEEKSSSSEASSSSVEESSSSEGTTVIGRVEASPRAFKAREIRRLDGSKIKAGEALVPGVYYVKGMDGRWKKQVKLP